MSLFPRCSGHIPARLLAPQGDEEELPALHAIEFEPGSNEGHWASFFSDIEVTIRSEDFT
jgi:hypothetical protein